MTAPSPRRRYRRHDPAARRHAPLVTDTEDHDSDSDLSFPSPKWADDAWDWFRRRPVWQQVAGWLFGFWALAVIIIWRSGLPPRWKANLTGAFVVASIIIGGTAIITRAVDKPERYTPPRAASAPTVARQAASDPNLARYLSVVGPGSEQLSALLTDIARYSTSADLTNPAWRLRYRSTLVSTRQTIARMLGLEPPTCLRDAYYALVRALNEFDLSARLMIEAIDFLEAGRASDASERIGRASTAMSEGSTLMTVAARYQQVSVCPGS